MKMDIHYHRVGNASDITRVDRDLYFNFAKEGEFLPFAQGGKEGFLSFSSIP
jgi:hypothetical protein